MAIAQMLEGAFNIPSTLSNIFNKILRKEDSLYTREEQPKDVQYTYGEYTYRGMYIQLIDKIVVEYESSKPTEVFVAERQGPDGVLTGSKRTIHFATPQELVAGTKKV